MGRKFLVCYPQKPRVRDCFGRKAIFDSHFEKHLECNFWQFLSLPIKYQIGIFLYRCLEKIKLAKFSQVRISQTIEMIPIDVDDIINGTIDAINTYRGLNYGRYPKYIFVGSQAYKEFVNFIKYEMMFHMPEHVLNSGKVNDSYFYGVKIVVTPWMQGFFLWGGEEDA